jgi:hypothetical protein
MGHVQAGLILRRHGTARPGPAGRGEASRAWRGKAGRSAARQAKTGLERPGYKYPLQILINKPNEDSN